MRSWGCQRPLVATLSVRHRFLACCLFLAGLSVPGLTIAGAPGCGWSDDGFHTSCSALPGPAHDAWHATVLIKTKEMSGGRHVPVHRTATRGAGIVLRIDGNPSTGDTRSVLIATNSHVIRPNSGARRIWVGFDSSLNPGSAVWTLAVETVADDPAGDLAFLRAEVPPQALAAEARLAAPGTGAPDSSRITAIGWPKRGLHARHRAGESAGENGDGKVFSTGNVLGLLTRCTLIPGPHKHTREMSVVLHDAETLPGSSGGPLVDSAGGVVGINSAILVSLHGATPAAMPVTEGGSSQHGAHLAISAVEIRDACERLSGCTIPMG